MKSKLIFKILVFIIIFVLSFLFFLDRSCIVVLKVGRSVYLEKITSISYEAIEYSLTNKKELNDLILIEKDNSNNVSFICTNAYKVNNLALSIAKSFKRKIQVEFKGYL